MQHFDPSDKRDMRSAPEKIPLTIPLPEGSLTLEWSLESMRAAHEALSEGIERLLQQAEMGLGDLEFLPPDGVRYGLLECDFSDPLLWKLFRVLFEQGEVSLQTLGDQVWGSPVGEKTIRNNLSRMQSELRDAGLPHGYKVRRGVAYLTLE